MKEVWKSVDIPGFEKLYEISNYGRLKALERIIHHKHKDEIRKEHFITLCNDKDNYKIAVLKGNGIKKTIKIHRLVASAFIPNPNNYKEVNHKDENKTNNNVNNLEWCSHSYNMLYGTRGIRTGNKLKKSINQYDLDGNFIRTWNGSKDIKKEINICNTSVLKCCRNKQKTAGGYIWKFKEELKCIEKNIV